MVNKQLELWQFIATRLERGENVMLLVVAESSGSSPGRQGYKMAVGADGELCGSIGGGVMEVKLVQESREILSEPQAEAIKHFPFEIPITKITDSSDANPDPLKIGFGSVVPNASKVTNHERERTFHARLMHQVHRENSPNASGMICSGKQTVVMGLILALRRNLVCAERMIQAIKSGLPGRLTISNLQFRMSQFEDKFGMPKVLFEDRPTSFRYMEHLGPETDLYIIGGGHCALALSELMSKMDFRISIFDDRPDLNTLQKNEFADEIKIIDGYDRIADHIPSSPSAYVVVMTLGYKSDAVVIRTLIGKEYKYFGVLGSKAKMATLMRELKNEGLPAEKLASIHTPIGLAINSRTPEEIAVSIAAEIISIKNAESR